MNCLQCARTNTTTLATHAIRIGNLYAAVCRECLEDLQRYCPWKKLPSKEVRAHD